MSDLIRAGHGKTKSKDRLEAMSEGKPTAGPWFVHDFREVAEDPNDLYCITISCSHPDSITVAYMGRALTATPEEALANAALIAQAPTLKAMNAELVEALERGINGIEWYRDTHPESWSEADDEWLEESKAVVAKAQSGEG